ncbi:MAG: hypothetical protein Q9219_004968 [cf. Caloplaca sp. 3 TL-2023]
MTGEEKATYAKFHESRSTVDRSFISASPATELFNGQYYRGLEQVLGHNNAEGIDFTYPWIFGNSEFNAYTRKLFPAATAATVSYIANTTYSPPDRTVTPYRNSLDRAALITSDVVINCNTYLLALAYQNRTYNYFFDVPPGLHGDDLHYTFGPDASTKSDQIRVAIQDFVTSFAATGDPKSSKQPRFERYRSTNQVLVLAPGSTGRRPDPAASNRCLMFQKNVWRQLKAA